FMYINTGDIMRKDVTLTGGTTVTIFTGEEINLAQFKQTLIETLNEEVIVRRLQDVATGRQIAILIESKVDYKLLQPELESILGYVLNQENSSVEMSGASLSESFYKQLLTALIIAFILMATVVLIMFRSIIPSLAVILAAITDVLGALAIANIFGFNLSTAGIAALLMLIGYSVDTDIMLTTKVIKRKGEGTVNSRIKSAFKTGLTMTLTSLTVMLSAYFVVQSPVLKQIFFILSAGLFIDLLATWFGNASILKWYANKKKIH
ncbi:MAG: MMPL family transporter, partial [Patescibacteria group bacterium]